MIRRCTEADKRLTCIVLIICLNLSRRSDLMKAYWMRTHLCVCYETEAVHFARVERKLDSVFLNSRLCTSFVCELDKFRGCVREWWSASAGNPCKRRYMGILPLGYGTKDRGNPAGTESFSLPHNVQPASHSVVTWTASSGQRSCTFIGM